MRKAVTITVFVVFIALVFAGLFQYSQKATKTIENDIVTNVDQTLTRNGFTGQYGEKIFIAVDGRDVILEGEAPNLSIQNAIEETVRSVYGVRKVQNNMSFVEAKVAPSKGISLSEALSDTPKEVKTNNNVLKETVVIDKIACDPEVCDAVKKSQEEHTIEEKQQ